MHIIVEDHTGRFNEGDLINEGARLEGLHRDGIITLPVRPDLLEASPVGGFFARFWGEGVAFDKGLPTSGCAMLMWIDDRVRTIHWRARLSYSLPRDIVEVRAHRAKRWGQPSPRGSLRLMPAPEVRGCTRLMAGPSTIANLAGVLDEERGVIHGTLDITSASEGYVAFKLQGASEDAFVVLSAMSAT